nr:hypothetical protein [uncultured Aminipila sp.]
MDNILCQKFNALDEYDENRLPIIKEFITGIGEKYYFQGPIQFNYGVHTYIGENFFANFNTTILDDGRIYIGDNVMFGPNVSLMATSHIGNNVVIWAGSIIIKDIPDNYLAYGNPCKPIRLITEKDSKSDLL